VLKLGAGPNGDGRFETVGDLVRHIFSAEARYIDRLCERPLTDPSVIPNDSVEALFEFGARTRSQFNGFLSSFPAERWDEHIELNLLNNRVPATPRKIVLHVLLHEIRHWPQIAALLRLNGIVADFRDFIFSPVVLAQCPREASA
jgi:uncharacterized damage-inducible protein DinB